MVRNLEDVKGGGGSIKLGSTGTISTLISRELESSSKASLPSISPPTSYNDSAIPRTLRTSSEEASSSQASNVEGNNHKKPETPRQTRHYPKIKSHRHHQIPMLEADNMSVDGTPIRTKPVMKKGVEIVDVKCGRVKPITTRLKKLGFAKLSDSVG